jgi:hypothetical protein
MNMSGVPKYTVNNEASPPWPSRGVGKGYAIAYPEFLRGPYSVFWEKKMEMISFLWLALRIEKGVPCFLVSKPNVQP